jgi:hypothetical protein
MDNSELIVATTARPPRSIWLGMHVIPFYASIASWVVTNGFFSWDARYFAVECSGSGNSLPPWGLEAWIVYSPLWLLPGLVPLLLRSKVYTGAYLSIWILIFLVQLMCIGDGAGDYINCYKRTGEAEMVIFILAILLSLFGAVGFGLFAIRLYLNVCEKLGDLAERRIRQWRQARVPEIR